MFLQELLNFSEMMKFIQNVSLLVFLGLKDEDDDDGEVEEGDGEGEKLDFLMFIQRD